MSIISLPGAQAAPTNDAGGLTNAGVAVARPRWSIERLIVRAFVMAIAVAVGFVIAFFIGVATGWIEFSLC